MPYSCGRCLSTVNNWVRFQLIAHFAIFNFKIVYTHLPTETVHVLTAQSDHTWVAREHCGVFNAHTVSAISPSF